MLLQAGFDSESIGLVLNVNYAYTVKTLQQYSKADKYYVKK